MTARFRVVISAVSVSVLLFTGVAALPVSAAQRGLEILFDRRDIPESDRRHIDRAYQSLVGAGLSEGDGLTLLRTCLDGGFDGRQTARVLSLTAQLQIDGLPVRGFTDKLREGVAKGVPAAEIVQVLERRGRHIKRADNLIKQVQLTGLQFPARAALVLDVAGALESGRRESEIRDILTEGLRKGESITTIRRQILP